MSQEPYYPVAMSDAEAALLKQAHQYRGSDVLTTDAPAEEAEQPIAQQAWEQVRTKLRRTVIGAPKRKPSAKSKKSGKSGAKKSAPKAKFVRGGAMTAAILSLMLMPMFGIFSSVAAIIITGRALLIGRLRGVMLVTMAIVQALAWALLFNIA